MRAGALATREQVGAERSEWLTVVRAVSDASREQAVPDQREES